MTLVAVSPFGLWQAEFATNNATYANVLLDAASEKAAWIFQNPKAKTIDRLCFRTATVTVGETVDVRLETVGADGNPSGTLAAANTNASQVIADANDNVWFEVTLTAGYTAAVGERLAVVIAMPAVTVGNLNIARGNGFAQTHPYVDHYTGSWARLSSSAIGAVRYSDATYANIPGLLPFSVLTNRDFMSTTNPDERGNKITVPFACKVVGLWHRLATSRASNYTLKLYDNADALLASTAVDGDTQNLTALLMWDLLDAEVTLAAGVVVRATVLATEAANTNLLEVTNPSGLAAATPCAGAMISTTRNDSGGSWTDTTGDMAAMGLIVSALDDGAGGGGALAYGFVG